MSPKYVTLFCSATSSKRMQSTLQTVRLLAMGRPRLGKGMVSKKHAVDLDQVLATRDDSGADYWSTPDGRIGVGGPFSTLESLLILSELGVPKSHQAVSSYPPRGFAGRGQASDPAH